MCGVPPGGRYWIYLGIAPLESARTGWGLQMLRFYFFIFLLILFISIYFYIFLYIYFVSLLCRFVLEMDVQC